MSLLCINSTDTSVTDILILRLITMFCHLHYFLLITFALAVFHSGHTV